MGLIRAELIAVGSELVHFSMRDTNSDWLTARLLDLGIRVSSRLAIEDDEGRIARAVTDAMERSPLVLVSGGLGPTEDDLTRYGIARALDRVLVRDDEIVAALERGFAARGYKFRPEQARQAERPEGAAWLPNPLGTAQGFVVEHGGGLLFALPGVPGELRRMFDTEVAPRVRARFAGRKIAHRVFRVSRRTESSLDTAIRDLYDEPGLTVTVLARSTGLEVLATVETDDAEESMRRLDRLDAALVERLGADLFGRDDQTLPQVLGDVLLERGLTLATAESCTAGLLSATVTEIPGSSRWYRGGVVVYADDLKTRLAGVPPGLIATHGAVSTEVAGSLATGVKIRCETDLGVGVTGIAGPGGATPDKPVGRVYVTVVDDRGAVEREFDLIGERALIRRRAVNAALDMVRRRALEGSPS